LENNSLNSIISIDHEASIKKNDLPMINKIVEHKSISVNEKYKKIYTIRPTTLLLFATNNSIEVSPDSGLFTRLILIKPKNDGKFPITEYRKLMANIKTEFPYIAAMALARYEKTGPDYYNDYIPMGLLEETDHIFNFMQEIYPLAKEKISLKDAYDEYTKYCDTSNIRRLPKSVFKEKVRPYFKTFELVSNRLTFGGCIKSKVFPKSKSEEAESIFNTEFKDSGKNNFDILFADAKAQYAKNGIPSKAWDSVTTKLKDLDTTKEHFVLPDKNVLVVDIDKKEDTIQDLEYKYLQYPSTYCEFSRNGGLHLVYLLEPSLDTSKLKSYEDEDEFKIYLTDKKSAIRRKVTMYNNKEVEINSMELKKAMVSNNLKDIKLDQKYMIAIIKKALRKEIHASTASNVKFIVAILQEATDQGIEYDLEPLKEEVIAFAANSTHQSRELLRLIAKAPWSNIKEEMPTLIIPEKELSFYDIEVFPNAFIVCVKPFHKATRTFVNPSQEDCEKIIKCNNLVGFNSRRYDDILLNARANGYTIPDLYQMSQNIVVRKTKEFGKIISYMDLYELSTKKQSLKNYELDMLLEQPKVPNPIIFDSYEEDWNTDKSPKEIERIAEYCANDVAQTENLYHYIHNDVTARIEIAKLSQQPVIASLMTHAKHIIFGNNTPECQWTDLSTIFKGYKFKDGVSSYKGEDPSEGGYVYSKPGTYGKTYLLDIESMHPTSLIELNYFGKYTKAYKDLVETRLKLKKTDPDLAYSYKIIINSIYGYTSASFPNPFLAPGNYDNIVAKRGSLFMIDLKEFIEKNLSVELIHIKTDSIKITGDVKDSDISAIMEFASGYGYKFVLEEVFDSISLINKAEYIAYKDNKVVETKGGRFELTRKLFSGEELVPEDYVVRRSVTTEMYLEMPNGKKVNCGKTNLFMPVKQGGILYRKKTEKQKNDSLIYKDYKFILYETWKQKPKDIDVNFLEDIKTDLMSEIERS